MMVLILLLFILNNENPFKEKTYLTRVYIWMELLLFTVLFSIDTKRLMLTLERKKGPVCSLVALSSQHKPLWQICATNWFGVSSLKSIQRIKNSILVSTQHFQKLGVGCEEEKSTNHPSLAYGEVRKYEAAGLEMYLEDSWCVDANTLQTFFAKTRFMYWREFWNKNNKETQEFLKHRLKLHNSTYHIKIHVTISGNYHTDQSILWLES